MDEDNDPKRKPHVTADPRIYSRALTLGPFFQVALRGFASESISSVVLRGATYLVAETNNAHDQ